MPRLWNVLMVFITISFMMSSFVPAVSAQSLRTTNPFSVTFDWRKTPVEVQLSSKNPQSMNVENVYSVEGKAKSQNVNVTTNPTKLTFSPPSVPNQLIFKIRPTTGGSVDSIWSRENCSEPPSVSTTLREDGRTFLEVRNNSSEKTFYFRYWWDVDSAWHTLNPGAVEGILLNGGDGGIEVVTVLRSPQLYYPLAKDQLCVRSKWNWSIHSNDTSTKGYYFGWDLHEPVFSASSIPVPSSSIIKVDKLYVFPGGYDLDSVFDTIPFYTYTYRKVSLYTLLGFTARLQDGSYISSANFRSVCSTGPGVEVYSTTTSAGTTTKIRVSNGTNQALSLRFVPNGINSNTVPWQVIKNLSSYTFESLPKVGRVEMAVDSSGTKTLCSYVTWNW